MTTDNTQDALFRLKNLPAEILAVDADRRFIRRYRRLISRMDHLIAPQILTTMRLKWMPRGSHLFNYTIFS